MQDNKRLDLFKKSCRTTRNARRLKAGQLEREIRESSASPREKANMLHTLSKLGILTTEERDALIQAFDRTSIYYDWWLDGQPEESAPLV